MSASHPLTLQHTPDMPFLSFTVFSSQPLPLPSSLG